MHKHPLPRGFSLLEMAISITIISMLIAAVVAGKSLKDRLELNQVVEDIGNIGTAVKEFTNTYNGLPGDMFNAESAFGAAATNNGNGDNDLADGSEVFLFWQHLSLAGLIEGTYDGTSQTMATPIKNGFYTVNKTAGKLMYISVSKASNVGLFTTKQAFDYDSKFDDGNPTSGAIRSVDGSGETPEDCASTTPDPDAYNLSNASESPCVIHFYLEQPPAGYTE